MNMTLIQDLICEAKKDWCRLALEDDYPGDEKATKWDLRFGTLNQAAQARALVRQIVLLEALIEIHVDVSTLQEADGE